MLHVLLLLRKTHYLCSTETRIYSSSTNNAPTVMKKLTLILMAASLAFATEAQTIYKTSKYTWKGNQFTQGSFKAKANSATDITSNFHDEWESSAPNFMPNIDPGINREHWTLKRDISHLPHYTSSLTIDNALFNMSLEESEFAIEPDSTYRTGVFWGGVWTRDVSYSILHALAQLNPEVCRKSLLAKVNANNRIIQDTGTGGAWPCSTDRTTWILAAWEVYLVTGDKGWLDRIFPVIMATLEDDHVVAYDPKTQLMHGETSWLDWREQEYPTWAQPADIYQSEAMGTTAVHYRSLRILAEICRLEGQPNWAKKYDAWADKLQEGMNKNLWMDDKGLYAIYLYGRNHLVQHPQMEILGESFAILWDIADADRQKRISENMVSEVFGTPDFYPNLKDQYPYHNDGMWPFTQGYWMKAQAKAGNEEGVLHAISSIYRLAAMALTNLENMVIYNGNEKGLPINSPRQLWSVAADIAIVPNIYFGVNYELDGIHFRPFVPKTLKANRQLSNFKYRDAVLNMTITGFGNTLKSFKLDGVETAPVFPADLKGEHTIEMVLDNKQPAPMQMVMKENAYQPLTPVASIAPTAMHWQEVPEAVEYIVLKDGKELTRTKELQTPLQGDGEYAVVAVNAAGWHSYMSEPLYLYAEAALYDVEDFALPFDPNRKAVKESVGAGSGAAGKADQRPEVPTLKGVDISGAHGNVAMITRNENIFITIPIDVAQDGTYAIDWRYANGNGPISTENKCATRVLKVDGRAAGVSVFPHRGTNEWNNWGWSNACTMNLKKGQHVVTLQFCDEVENMNIYVNQALLDQMRVTKL
jgi:hypothetical protein